MRMHSYAALGLAVVALGAAGCGDDDDDGGQAATTPAPATQTTQEQTTPTATTPSSGRSAVTISATEFAFNPANPEVKAGQVAFRLKNDGGAPHALEVEGNGIEEASKVINGGQTTTLGVTLKAGTYTIYCPVGNHRQQGMEGELTVS
jgi:plastocyanin